MINNFLLKKINPESPGWLLLLGGLVGLFTGGVTVLYRLAVQYANEAIWGAHQAHPGYESTLLRFFLPSLGGLLVGALLYLLLSYKPGHGIPAVIHAMQTNRIHIPWRIMAPSLSSVIVLTSGGSAGPEGPVAEIGSVFGSNIGGWFRASPKVLRALVGCGVAAAIAAVFGVPIGGVFFALEVIFQGFEMTLFGPVVMAAVLASLVSGSVFEYKTAVVFPAFSFQPGEFPMYLILGLLTGLISAFFIFWMDFASRIFEKSRIPLWLRPAIGGLGVGLIGVYLPDVIGEGYESLNRTFQGRILITEMALILGGKILATGLTIGSGAPGGCFAPAIFIGGIFGGLYGALLEHFFPSIVASPTSYALIGMAGALAGIFNAPMTAIFIGLRVANESFDALIPLMSTVALSTLVMSRWDHVSVYTQILRRHGQWFPMDYEKDPLLRIQVEEVLNRNPKTLDESLSVEEAVAEISGSEESAYVAVDEQGAFKGVLALNDLRLALADPVMGKLVNLSDVLDISPPRLSPTTNLREAVQLFSTHRVEALPVFDSSHVFIGLVTRESLFAAYGRHNKGSASSSRQT